MTSIDNRSCSDCHLKQSSIFKNFKALDFENLLLEKKQEAYSKKQQILKQGDPSKGIICIREGLVKVYRTNKKNNDFIFSFAHAGDLLGIDSFINDSPHSFSVVALEPVKLCMISNTDLKTILQEKPEVSLEIMKVFCEHIDFIEKRMVSIAQKGIKEQVAEIILLLGHNRKSKNYTRTIHYSVIDLANIIGTTKNYIYKILSDFSKNDIIKVERRKLIITDIEKLSKIAIG